MSIVAVKSESLAQVIGEKELSTMKKKSNSDLPIGKLKKINDFLPPPDELVLPEETVKVTLSLTKSSVEFFKREAKRYRTKYQKMIRELIDQYSKHY